ncbi:MAG TPA: ABC transporter substrate binding protein [bacterium]|nr:ABC transporter substrate binding protein [bacterium]HPN31765.1 ABC transporter substrate binding protein [bacterium]
MKRFLTIFIFTLIIFVSQSAADKIVIVKSRALSSYDEAIEGFKETITASSSIGNSLEILDMKGDDKIAEDIVKQLKNDDEVKIIVTLGARASEMIASEIKHKPILFSYVLNWKNYSALRQPNVTGIEFEIPANVSLTLFKMIAPNVKKIGIIYNESNSKDVVSAIDKEIQNYELKLYLRNISSPSKLKKAYKELINDRIDALWLIADPVLTQDKDNFKFITEESKKNKIATLAVTEKFVELFGMLFAVAPDYKTIGSQSANMTQNILNGQKIQDMPVETPIGTINVLNLKTAEMINLKFDEFLLKMFNKVYE